MTLPHRIEAAFVPVEQHNAAHTLITAWQRSSEKATARAEAAEADNARLRKALHDAIQRPMGVVPESADEFYSPTAANMYTTLADSDGDDGA